MGPDSSAVLTRDCEAVLIPTGEKCLLSAGASVVIAQTLGGSFTVEVGARLARIDGRDADALGLALPAGARQDAGSASEGPVTEARIWEELKTCYDPEIPVNIVDLGLVYSLRIEPQPDRGSRVEVRMTLTAPGCGMGAMIADDVRRKVLALPGVSDASVELVFDPPWNQGMMTEAARLELGLM